MSPKNVYQDDDALTSFLDGLIESAKENETPTNATSMQLLSGAGANLSFTSKQLHTGIDLSNQLLREGGQCSPLPDLNEDNENLDDVLAAALTAIVRLSRCCKANANLRTEAENATQAAQTQVQNLSRTLRESNEKLEKKESSLVDMRKRMNEMDVKAKSRIRQLTSDCNSLKSRLATATHRENHLMLEANQREKQYSQLQKRVHSLMSNTKKFSIDPVITTTSSRLKNSRQKVISVAGETDDIESNVVNGEVENEDHYNEAGPAVMVLDENHFMRSTIRAIHVELDDLFDSYPKAFPFLNRPEDENPENSAEDDKEKEEMPPSAPSEEQMLLPCEMIKEEYEANLERKLQVVRKALSTIE